MIPTNYKIKKGDIIMLKEQVEADYPWLSSKKKYVYIGKSKRVRTRIKAKDEENNTTESIPEHKIRTIIKKKDLELKKTFEQETT